MRGQLAFNTFIYYGFATMSGNRAAAFPANMDELDAGSETVLQNVARLLQTGKSSNLTLRCQQLEFFVHTAIVCARSPVWAAAVEGSFQVRNGVERVKS